MTERSIPALHGLTADTIGQEITLTAGDVTYEGRLAAIDGDVLTLEDCYPTTAADAPTLDYGRHVVTLDVDSRVWLDLHEDDFESVSGVVMLADDGTIVH